MPRARVALVCAALLLPIAVAAAAQEPAKPVAAPPARIGAFTLRLDALFSPRYDAARELRLGLWDSPMSRLELAAARELWAARSPGPLGIVPPVQHLELPLRLGFASDSQFGLWGPWSRGWNELSWQEKVAYGAQSGLLLWVVVEAARHL